MYSQPPSGGCVLKQRQMQALADINQAAAFGRLCVETAVKHCLPRYFGGSHLRAAVC